VILFFLSDHLFFFPSQSLWPSGFSLMGCFFSFSLSLFSREGLFVS
jgi:hypothetical protein